MSVELYFEIIMDLLLVPGEKETCQMKTDFSVNLYFSFSFNSRIPLLLFAGVCGGGEKREVYKEGFCPQE